MPHELTKIEREILSQMGPIRHGAPGRPTNKKLALVAQIAAIDAYLSKKQIKEATSEQPTNPTT